MKIVINTVHGGFGLSHKAMTKYCELKGLGVYPEKMYEADWLKDTYMYWTVPAEERIDMRAAFDQKDKEITEEEYNDLADRAENQLIDDYKIPRDDPILVQIVEEMGQESWGNFAKLKVVEIPDDVNWYVDEYDGIEWVAEVHRKWS